MKILVLGGGFAGVEAVIKLRKYGYEVTLISDRDYMFIYPISIWIPVGGISFEDTKLNLYELQKKHGFNLIIEKITKIDNENQQIITDKSIHSYDYLFIGLGMSKAYVKGSEFTHSICGKPQEAITIKDKLEKLVAKDSGTINVGFGGNPKDPTSTTVRGGPAFELLFNISNFLNKKGLREKFKLTFFAPMAEPGKRMGDRVFKSMGAFFERYHVNTHFGIKIKEFTKDAIVFANNTQLNSDLTLFISGGDGMDLIKNTSLLKNETGFLKINELCRVENEDNIYAIGDGAAFVMRTSKKEIMIPLPIVGHWLKKGWGWYYKQSKMKRMFRIPGM